MNNRIQELEAEIARLKAELEKLRERERDMDETRRAMLFMLQDLTESEDNLSRARNEWEATFDSISDPIFVHDKELKIIRANRAYVEAGGMPFKEVIGKKYFDVFPKMEKPFKICLKALELQEEEEEEEFSYPVTNRIFKIRFYPIKDVNGGYLYSIHILEDITEAKMAADMLQRAHRRLSILYNIDRSVSQSLGLNEILNNALSMTLKTLEVEAGAIVLIDPDGKTATIQIHHGLSEEFVKNLRHIKIDEGISGRAMTERKAVTLNISEYPTEKLAPFMIKEGFQTFASTPLISAGKVFGALTLATRKIKAFPPEETEMLTSIGIQLGTAVQNALLYQSMMTSEERYRGLVETSADAIVSVNYAREIVQWNDSASRIFGYSKDEIMGKLIDTIVPEEYQDRHIEGFKRYIETGESKIIGKPTELKGLRKDGFIVPVELSLSVLRTGESYIFTGIIRDLTERKRAEQENIQQQKLATMGHLISGITHEIKNPLNIISGNVQILNMEEQDTEKKKVYEIVLQQVDRSVKIIDNLLGFARRREYEIRDVSINNLIESTIRLVEYEMKLENIIFVRDFDKELPLIKGDADQLAQVFLNMINNARDSMNEKQKRIRSGELKIEGWKGEIRITTKKTDNMVEINFADTGLGISEDKVINIFKPFFTTKAEGKGTGLGLSIAKDIIGKHGGKIELENMAGEGVKFIIRLPC